MVLFPLYRIPPKTREQEEEDERSYRRYAEAAAALPEDRSQEAALRQLDGFWFYELSVPGILAAQQHFAARPTDILLASVPKCGTTWLKALLFCVAGRSGAAGDRHPRSPRHPLLELNPHECVPFIEDIYAHHKNPNLEALPSPRLLSTHLPFSMLPESVKIGSGCRLIFVCRDVKDCLVSRVLFLKKMQHLVSVDCMVERFRTGIHVFGPIWECILEYWEEHRKRPHEVVFLRYEDVKKDPTAVVRRLAAFVGRPFSEEEEREGVVEAVVSLCSLENLKRVSKEGSIDFCGSLDIERKSFFRKGEVGDWKNHMTPATAERLDEVTRQKFQGSGLVL